MQSWINLCSFAGEDDEPEDGPEHYILLLGFYQPPLLWALDALGVQVSCVIQVDSKQDEQQGHESSEGHETSEEREKSDGTPSSVDAGASPPCHNPRWLRVSLATGLCVCDP